MKFAKRAMVDSKETKRAARPSSYWLHSPVRNKRNGWTQLNTNLLVIVWYKRTNPEEIRGHYLLIYSTRVDQVIWVVKKSTTEMFTYYQLTTGLILAPVKSTRTIFAVKRLDTRFKIQHWVFPNNSRTFESALKTQIQINTLVTDQ